MSTQTLYITTANYATRVATQANASITTLNETLQSVNINNAYAIAVLANAVAINAYSNAITANFFAQLAYSNAIYANTLSWTANATAVNANATAVFANATAVYANTVANQSNATAVYANIVATQANATAVFANTVANQANALAWSSNILIFTSNLIATQANATATYANIVATQANATAVYANLAATNANLIAPIANVIAVFANTVANQANALAWSSNILIFTANLIATQANATATYANLAATNANLIAPFANATAVNANTTATYANIVANQANTTATYANLVANQANILAVSTNNFVTTVNAAAEYIYKVFANVMSSGFDPIWSNIGGNVYTFQNVGIGTALPSNTLDVVGNVYITGNIIVRGTIDFPIITTGTLMTLDSPLSVTLPNTSKNEILVIPSNWTRKGYLLSNTADGGIIFNQVGIFNILLNIQGTDSSNEYDRLGSINVYTSTSNFQSANLIYSDSAWSSYGPPTHNITVPLNVTSASNVYYFAFTFFRNNFPYTMSTRSFVEFTPITPVGIPVLANAYSYITQSPNYPYIGVNQIDPAYNLDIGGDVNYTGTLYRRSQQLVTGNDGNFLIQSNVGINTTGYVSNALEVYGNAFVSEYLFANVSQCSGLPDDTFKAGTTNVYTLQNVGVGTSTVSNALDVVGNVFVSQFLFANISYCTGAPITVNPWNVGTGNVYYTGNVDVTGNVNASFVFANVSGCTGLAPWFGNVYTTSKVSIGSSTPPTSNALDVYGNVYVSGRISSENVFMVACSDETSSLQVSSPTVTFRTPMNWILTRPPRATLRTAGTTNIMVQVNSSNLFVNELSIPNASYSSKGNEPTIVDGYIPDDSSVVINITRTDTNASGLKVLFYYMPV